tara:strand:+ start:84 stop:326 length:243 start_codon:yes stop_codon:yes gene_type:complete
MDEKIIKILENKIDEINSENPQIDVIMHEFKNLDSNSLYSGIKIGRLFNSFYYQHRRILNRSPTEIEFKEFIKFLKNKID